MEKKQIYIKCKNILKRYACQQPYLLARIVVIILSFGVMLYFADDFSLWSDDLATIEFVSEQNTLSQNIESILADATHNPPLYYVLAYIWLRIMPYGTVFIKLLNIILVCVGTVLLGSLAKKIRGDSCSFYCNCSVCNIIFFNFTSSVYIQKLWACLSA